MPILNYTTKVPIARSISEIQALLSRKGAQSITQEYEGGTVSALSFAIKVGLVVVRFALPVNTEGVLKAMTSSGVRNRSPEQAQRVAWRILKDWIEAQMALIESGQAALAQVFMPYAQQRDGRTMYELWFENNQKALPNGKQEIQ